MHQAVTRQWLENSAWDIFLVDSYGLGIQDPTILQHPRFKQHVFSQNEKLGRPACARELRTLGPTNLEKLSIIEIIQCLPCMKTYQYIFKITAKYYFKNHAPLQAAYHYPLVYQHRHAARWQHSEILGARPATLLQLMQGLPPGHLMERYLPKAPMRFHRLPPIPLQTTHPRSNNTTLTWL